MSLLKISSSGFFYKESIWLSPEFILQVNSNILNEVYSRYYFKDIQSIINVKTNSGRVINLIIGFYSILALLSGMFFLKISIYASITFYVTGLIFLFVSLANTLKGPTCECYIKTPVQNVRIKAVSRMKKFEKFNLKIQEKIFEAQGKAELLSTDEPSKSSSEENQRV